MEEWEKPKAEVWSHGVRILNKIVKRSPQLAFYSLGMSLQLEWKSLQRTVPRVGAMMGPIEDSQRDTFFLALFGGEDINADLRIILEHSVKRGELCIP